MGLEQSRADQRSEGQRKGDMRGQSFQSERRSSRIAASTPITASRLSVQDCVRAAPGREVVRQGEPEHAADTQCDERRLEPELRTEGPAAGGSRKPVAAMAMQGKKANCSTLIAACTAGSSMSA